MLEIEFKTKIDKKTYNEIISKRLGFAYYDITNRYFDSPKLDLAKNGHTLRLRTTEDEWKNVKYEITFKKFIEPNRHEEYTEVLDENIYQQWLLYDIFPSLNIYTKAIECTEDAEDLYFNVVSMVKRAVAKLGYGKIMVDDVIVLSDYKQTSYYELEYECDEQYLQEGKKEFEDFCKTFGIEYVPSKNKYQEATRMLPYREQN